jgi:hypothetical protein
MTWTDEIQDEGKAYNFLKSEELKEVLASRKNEGFEFVIFPDNKNHLHLDVR